MSARRHTASGEKSAPRKKRQDSELDIPPACQDVNPIRSKENDSGVFEVQNGLREAQRVFGKMRSLCHFFSTKSGNVRRQLGCKALRLTFSSGAPIFLLTLAFRGESTCRRAYRYVHIGTKIGLLKCAFRRMKQDPFPQSKRTDSGREKLGATLPKVAGRALHLRWRLTL